jgi:hypothetical protein
MQSWGRAFIAFFCAFASFAQDAAHPSGWVVIPIQEYGTLRGKAFPTEHEPETRIEAALTRVDYELKVDGTIASGRASLTIDVLKDGWVRVPMPPGLLVREARVDGNRVSLISDSGNNGQLAAVLSRKGRSTLTLDVSFVLTGSPGQEQLALPSAGAGVTRASVTHTAPPDAEVKVSGGFLGEKSDTHWLAYGRGDDPLVFVWRRRIVDQQKRVELPLRMRGTLTQLFGLGEDSTSLNAEVEVEVVQGAAHQVRIAVPATVTINQVPGALVADWDVKGGELVVTFLEPVEHSAKFAIGGETRLAREGAIQLPLLRLLETERDAGGVAVEVLGAGEVKDSRTQGVDPVEAAELGAMVAARQSPSLAAFRNRAGASSAQQPRSIEVQVARYAQQAVLTANVEEARYRALMTIDGKTLVQARYAVRNNQRTFMRITLPEAAVVWSSSVAGRPVRPGKGPDGSLLLPLEKSRAGDEAPVFAVEILYLLRGTAWTGKGSARLALPAVDLPISRTGLSLYYPPQFRVTPETGAFHAQPYEKPATELWNPPPAAEVESSQLAPSSNAQSSATQALVNSYRARPATRRTASTLPVHLTFPAVGPSLYLVSELTGEGKGAVIDIAFQTANKQKDKKEGGK